MKNIINMGSLGSSVFLLVMLVQLQLVVGKPFFTELICDLLCDDDDDTTTSTTTASNEDDYLDFFGLCSCGTQKPPTAAPLPPAQVPPALLPATLPPASQLPTLPGAASPRIPSNLNIRLPPSPNGINFSFTNNNGLPWLNFDAGPPIGGAAAVPIGAPPGGSADAAPTTLPPPVTAGGATTASATTAAAAATTAKP